MDSEVKFYAVKKGRKTGIFNTWEECKEQVHGYSGCQFKSFSTYEEAVAYLDGECADIQRTELPGQIQLPLDNLEKIGIENKPQNQKPEFKNIKLYVLGSPENENEPGYYFSVLEYNSTRKVLVKSFFEEATPKQLAIRGIIDAISIVKMPCKIQIYTTAAVDVKKKKKSKDDLISELNNLIQEKGHDVEFLKNAKLVKDTIKKVKAEH